VKRRKGVHAEEQKEEEGVIAWRRGQGFNRKKKRTCAVGF